MPDNKTEQRRLAYIFNDINSLDLNQLKVHEVLLDYKNNDIIIVKEDKSTFSLFDYIGEKTKNFLKDSHMELANQHLCANETRNGFMSMDDFKLLYKCAEGLTEISKYLLLSQNESFTSESLLYRIENDNELYIEVIIKNNNVSIRPSNNRVVVPERPSIDFINAYSKVGYKDCLIAIDINDDYKIKIFDNVVFNDDFILADGKTFTYNSNTKLFVNDNGNQIKLMPLYKIRLRNSSLISSENILGKLNNDNLIDNEIIDISRVALPNSTLQKLLQNSIPNLYNSFGAKIHSKVLQSNIKSHTNEDTKLYISMNKNQNDLITGQTLKKKVIYKKSPFGYMARKSLSDGDYISLNDIEDFCLEVLIDNTSSFNTDNVINDNVIVLKDSKLTSILELQAFNDGKFKLNALSNGLMKTLSEFQIDRSIDYQFIKLAVNDGIIEIYLDEVLLDREPIDSLEVKFLSVPTLNISFGELRIEPYGYVNKVINKNVYLTSTNVSNDDDLIISREAFSCNSESDKFTIDYTSHDNIIDYIDVYFENQLVDQAIEEKDKIEAIEGNKIYIKNCKDYNIGEYINIINGIDNIKELYQIKDIVDDIMYLDKLVDDEFIGYYVSKYQLTVPIKLFNKSGELLHCKIIKYDYYIRIYFNEAYSINDEFIIQFITVMDNSKIVDKIASVDAVQFANKYDVTTTDVLQTLDAHNVNMSCNGIIINDSIKNKPLVAIGDSIEFDIDFNIFDFIKSYSNNSPILRNMSICALFNISGGSNDILINDKKINTKGNIIPYVLDNIPIAEDGTVEIKIKTNKDITNGKVITSDLRVLLLVKGYEAFSIENINKQITDFGIINNNKILINSADQTSVFIVEKIEDYNIIDIIEPNNILTEAISGYVLYNHNNIVKLLNVLDKKIYLLDKYYVI